ncbi:MAG: hypothetical protein N3E49_05270 [Bacteroidia bacterium]|nr:hypothetical protein [Bacteroidia bacterium]
MWLPNGTVGSILLIGPGGTPTWAPNPICTSPTLNRFIKFTSTTPTTVGNTTLAENANNNIWNADGSPNPIAAADKFEIIGTAASPFAINGYTTVANAFGVYGQATGSGGSGVWGATNQSNGWGVYGNNTATTGTAVGVQGVTASTTGIAVVGIHNSNSGTGTGVAGQTNSPAGTAGVFINAAAAGSAGGDGAIGQTAQAQGFGVLGVNTNSNGTGVVGAGNNSTPTYLTNGSGGAFTGTNTGTFTLATSNAGTALYALNNAAYSTTATGGAGAFVSRAGAGSVIAATLRNDANTAWIYYANTVISAVNMRADGNPWGIVGAVANAGAASPGIGVVGINTSTANDPNTWAVYGLGRLGASGAKSFFIDHPLDPANKYLAHYSSEGPEPYTIYRGTAVTDASGRAVVELPSYFEALNRPGDYHYSLTCIGTFAQAIVEEEIRGNRFTIRTDKPNVKVAWVVTGVRNDVYARHFWMADEVEKSPGEKGKYLIPELYGKGAEYGIFSSRLRESKTVQGPYEIQTKQAPTSPLSNIALPKGKAFRE